MTGDFQVVYILSDMVTPLYLELQKTHGKVMGNCPAFFESCVKHLGFLVTEFGFEFHCDYLSGTEKFIRAEFKNLELPLCFVVMWECYNLPYLGIGPRERCFFERGLLPKLNNEDAEYGVEKLLKDKTEAEQQQIMQRHNDRVAERIKQIGIWVRENYAVLVSQ
jgi:hypothetical protein